MLIISGFLVSSGIEDIHQILLTQGLPDRTEVGGLLRNEKTGRISIENLSPEECLLLMEKMHGRSFLERKVFVTSVVGASPKKYPIVQPGFHANSEDTVVSSSNSSPSAATDKIPTTSSTNSQRIFKFFTTP